MYDLKLEIHKLFKNNLDFIENKEKNKMVDIIMSFSAIEKMIRENKNINKDSKKIVINNLPFLIISQTFNDVEIEKFKELIEIKEDLNFEESYSIFCYIPKDYLLEKINEVVKTNQLYKNKFISIQESMEELPEKIDIAIIMFNALIKVYQFCLKNNFNLNNKEFQIIKEMYNQQKQLK